MLIGIVAIENNYKEERMMDTRNLTQYERDIIAKKIAEDNLEHTNEISKEVRYRETFYNTYVKRIIDIIISLSALIVTFPINLIIFLITLIDVGKPIFFFQERSGRKGKIFKIVKFRNMTNEVDGHGELLPAAQRVTRWGRIVRKTSLDELLNFIPVLMGDMSLIGPRPLTPHYLERYSNRHKARLKVRPGLECPPWQTDLKSWDWEDRFENDVWYAENISFRVDCIMIIRLIQYAFNKKFSTIRANAKTGIFIGYNEDGKAVCIEELSDQYVDSCIKQTTLKP